MGVNIYNKKILVTGGAGFIGSNLCEELLRLGNEVVCFDNFATGKRENIIEFLACFLNVPHHYDDLKHSHQVIFLSNSPKPGIFPNFEND